MKRLTKKLLALFIILAFLLQSAAVGATQASQASQVTQTGTAAAEPGSRTAYSDVSANDGNFIFINYLNKRGLLKGFPDGTFRPASGLTRAEAAAVLVRAAGLKLGPAKAVFRDVGPKYWAAASISAARGFGLLSGYPDGTFRPEALITRAEGLALVLKLSKQRDPGVGLPVLADVTSKHWAARTVAVGVGSGMMGLASDNKHFLPDKPLTRGTLARALAVLLTKDPALYETTLTNQMKVAAGPVTLYRAGSNNPVSVQDTTALQVGDTVYTGTTGKADITFPDGTGLHLEKDCRFTLKEARGRSYIKADGAPGTSVEWISADLKNGTMFGALATSTEADNAGSKTNTSNANGNSAKAAGIKAQALGLGSFSENRVRTAAAADTKPLNWWQQSGVKRTRVKIDMPTGVAAIRGTFWQNTVNPDGSFSTSVLVGQAVISSGGQTVSVAAGQSTAVTAPGAPPVPPAPLTPAQSLAWVQVTTWVQQQAQQIQAQQEQALPPPPPAEKPEQPAPPQQPQQPQQQTPVPDQPKSPAPTDIISLVESALESVGAGTVDSPVNTSTTGGSGVSSGGDSSGVTTPAPAVSTYPADGDTNVSIHLNEIRIGYNKHINDNDLSGITLTNNTAGSYVYGLISNVQGTMLFIDLAEVSLDPGTSYTLTVPSEALKDDAGSLVDSYTLDFTTEFVTTITGRVYSPLPLSSALDSIDASGTAKLYSLSGGEVASSGLNVDGAFTLNGVPVGDYILKVKTLSSQFTNSNAIPIHVVDSQPLFKTVNLTSPMVVGKVYQPDSIPFNPVPGVSYAKAYITPLNLNCNGEEIKVNSDGTFMFGGLPSGRYSLRVESYGSNNPYTDSFPVEVDLVQGITKAQNILLTNPTVTGTVYDSAYTPYQSASLNIYPINTEYRMKNITVYPDASFRIGGLHTGDYIIETSYLGILYNSRSRKMIHVTEGTTQVVNIVPDNEITVTGTVLTPAGNPYGVMSGYLGIRLDDGNGTVRNASVGSTGDFSVKVPAAGNYKLSTEVQGALYTDALPVNVNVYNGMPPVNVSLTNPQISGKILNPDSSPFVLNDSSCLEVLVYNDTNGFSKLVYVNSDGTFKIGGLTAGSYKIHTIGSSDKYAEGAPLNIQVVDGTSQNLTLTLNYPVISGKVTLPDVELIPKETYVGVTLYDSNGNSVAKTTVWDMGDGTFGFGPVSPGNYKLAVNVFGDNPFAAGTYTDIQVSGTPITANLSLSPVQISGKISSGYGYVIINNESGETLGRVEADDGIFKIGTLNPGTYKIVDPSNNSFADVTVTSGGPIVNITL